MAEWTDSGRLVQRDGAQEWKALAPLLVRLDPRDWQTLFDLSEQDMIDAASMAWIKLILNNILNLTGNQ